ncbi:MAG TPA: amino acid adenylation domain-containing protein [Pyrinomonadaceae bacterium]
MSSVAGDLAHLSAKQRAVLELRLKRKRVDTTSTRIPYLGRDSNTFPVSYAQQRLWFIDQLEPGSAFYNAPAAVRLKGPLNLAALERTLNEIARRHETLHTRFATIDGQPVQVIDPSIGLPLRMLDLRQFTVHELRNEIPKVIREEATIPLDLTTGPLMCACLLRLGDEDHLLHLTMHHIISDGWSLGVFFEEMSVLYHAYIGGLPSPLPELPVQYADYSVWQREYLRGEVLEKQLSYWRQQLADASPVLELTTDYSRPAVQSFRGASQPIVLSQRLKEQLQQLGRREGVTLFMSLLAAFDVLLWRYTGQTDLSVGTPIAGRNQSETEGLIGFFANTLVLRVRIDGSESFLELLNRVREVTLGAFAHQDLPFERLVEEMQPERDMSHHPLFQVMFVIHSQGRETVTSPELELSMYPVESGLAKFDLTLLMTETEEGLLGSLEYNTDLFDPALVQRMAQHLETLVESALTDPQRPLAELSLSTPDERRQLLNDWNPRETVFPRTDFVHTLIQQQARQTPEATAIVCGSDELTYADLNMRANQLAHYLRSLGVGPEVVVGVCMERSLEVVISLLAILKSGGAYLPLDPENPPERLAHMLEATRTPVLLTQQPQLHKFHGYQATTVCLDADWPVIAKESSADPDNVASEENLAYVIFTSGSTGRPKGVCISQQAACNHFKVIQKEFELTANDRVLQFSSLSFDVSLEQILPTLMSGACVVLRNSELWTPADFRAKARELQLTVANLPTAYWHQVVSETQRAETTWGESLRLLIIGGDVLMPESAQAGEQVHGESLRLLNAYGPTETTVTASAFDVPQNSQNRLRARVPIGRPFANRAMYVLDRLGALAAVGVPGELYIGGAFMARGYLNEPELTAEKFVPDPFSKHAGARMYRSGDLARFLPDGNVEYLGRIDNQVKIRGYRIELGEIESAMTDHPLLQEVAVVVRTDSAAQKRIIAYVVLKHQEKLSVTALRGYLKERLPEYMVPAVFVFLERLPLTSTGKVDRRALPTPEQERADGGVGYVAPRTIVEEVLVGLWEDVLRVKPVGVYDNFFELGGHSLLATQLMSRVRQSFAVEVALRRIFETPTIAALAENIEELRFGGAGSRPAVERVSRAQRLPLSYAQQRLWFLEQMEPGSAIYNVPLALRVSGELAVEVLEASLREVVRRHEVLRTRFVLRDGEAEQVIDEQVEFKLGLEDLSGMERVAAERAVQEQARTEAQRGFDLSTGPLLRAKLLRLSANEHVLLLTMHHIVSDGWSLGVLVKELGQLYQAYAQGERAALAELEVQYADYAVWQREYLQGEVLEQQLSYWREQLAGAAPVLELPTDRPRPQFQTFNGSVLTFDLPVELSNKLMALSRREGTTLFMTLLAAFDVLLWRYTGQADLSVGTPIAGRNQAEIEGLIGFFVNTLVLRVQLDGRESFRELLGRVREVTLGAYGHQDVPFERLVEELQPERDLSHTPLFQVAFALQNVPQQQIELPGITLRAEESESQAAKFSLVMILHESDSGVQGSLTYNTDLFDASTIERMVQHFTRLLSAASANPDQPIADLPMLTGAERDRLLVEWNETATQYPRESSIQKLFEEQVTRTPKAVAITQGDRQLSYEELNRRANQLAHYLQKQGVGPDVLVGICCERGIELNVGLLGILKAGGAYVPFDPNYPASRLSFMLADSGIATLLTQESLRERLPEHQLRRICLDTDWQEIALEDDQDLGLEVQPENLAYVIYTSGSTGTPKGVCIPHRGVIRLVMNTNYAELQSSDKFAPTANASFDAATFEIWGSLLHGAQQIVFDREVILSPPALAAQLEESGVTVLFLVTALLNHFAGVTPQAFAKLRYVMFGGEAIDPGAVRRILEAGAPQHLLNCYGPTETTTYATFYPVQEVREGANTVSIGRPISNSQVYILDQNLEPVPIGVAGELYLGGDGLARGYLRRPELTAERFVPHPFAQNGSRLYRTGDLGRFLPDGNIEFLGRIDHQVQLRGFRVELGEIESTLNKHPDLRESVVVFSEDETDKQLVGYVVANENAAVTATGLRSYLKEHLPEFMVPSAFVFLEKLPLTANGKVDRRALPAPERTDGGVEYMAPRTIVEEVLVGLWQDVLGAKQVGVYDNFFELGGHSLLAMQLMSRLRQSFGVELPLRALFESPSVARIATVLVSVEETPGRIEKIAVAIKKVQNMSTEEKDEIREQMKRSKGQVS